MTQMHTDGPEHDGASAPVTGYMVPTGADKSGSTYMSACICVISVHLRFWFFAVWCRWQRPAQWAIGSSPPDLIEPGTLLAAPRVKPEGRLLTATARDPNSAEAEEMRWLETFVDQDDVGDE